VIVGLGNDIAQIDSTFPKLRYRHIMNEKSEVSSDIGSKPPQEEEANNIDHASYERENNSYL